MQSCHQTDLMSAPEMCLFPAERGGCWGGINTWSYHGEGTDVAHDRCVWSNFHVPRVPNPEFINMQRPRSEKYKGTKGYLLLRPTEMSLRRQMA